MCSARYVCPILTKFEFTRHFFIEDPINTFHGNTSNGSRAYTRRQQKRETERQLDENDKLLGAF